MDRESIDRARLGLTFVFLAVATMAGVVCITVGIMLLAILNPCIASNPVVWMFLVAVPFIMLIASGVSISGKALCLPLSRRIGRFDMLLTAVVFHGVTGFVSVAGFAWVVPGIVGLLTHGLTLAGFVLFLLCIRRLAEHMNEPHLAERTTGLMVLCATIAALAGLTFLCTMYHVEIFGLLLGLATLGAMIACVAGYLRLLLHTRDCLTIYGMNSETSAVPFAKPAPASWGEPLPPVSRPVAAEPLAGPPVAPPAPAQPLVSRPVVPPPIGQPLTEPRQIERRCGADVSFGESLELDEGQADPQP